MLTSLIRMLSESFRDLLPLIGVLILFQLFVLRLPIPNVKNVVIGTLYAIFGLFIFIRGLKIGLFPLGESMGINFAQKGSIFWISLFAFILGYTATIAEPALIAIALKSEEVSQGAITGWQLRQAVAIGVAFGITYGVIRIIFDISLPWSLIVGYLLICLLTYVSPKNIIGLAYDCGGVTTGTITVPLVAALGIGIASSISGRDPIIDGFGLIAFASLAPIMSVLIFGGV